MNRQHHFVILTLWYRHPHEAVMVFLFHSLQKTPLYPRSLHSFTLTPECLYSSHRSLTFIAFFETSITETQNCRFSKLIPTLADWSFVKVWIDSCISPSVFSPLSYLHHPLIHIPVSIALSHLVITNPSISNRTASSIFI